MRGGGIFLRLFGFRLWMKPESKIGSLSRPTLATFPRLRGETQERNGKEKAKTGSGKLVKQSVFGLRPLLAISCLCEYLLKECVSRQEKLPFCHKNSATTDAYIRDFVFRRVLNRILARILDKPCTEEEVARAQHLDALP